MKYALETKDLSVSYGTLQALDKINIKIKEKDFLGIIGPNGGGKTSFLKAILGLVQSSGSIKLFSEDKSRLEAEHILGFVPQFSSFDLSFPINVYDVVAMGRLPKKIKTFFRLNNEDKKIIEKTLKELNLLDLKDRQIGQLSGGQLQRVLIARSLVGEPSILLLDEPTASLDAESKKSIYSLLDRLNKDITIIIVSHDLSLLSEYVRTIAILDKKLIFHGDLSQALGGEKNVFRNYFDL